MKVKYSTLKVKDQPKKVDKTETLTIKIIADFIQFYLGGLTPLLKGSCTCETALFIYLINNINENKLTFNNDINFYNDVNNYFDKYKKNYSRIALNKALTFLEVNQLIVRLERGKYTLNPMYFWAGRAEDRKDRILELYKKGKIKVIDSDIKLTETGI